MVIFHSYVAVYQRVSVFDSMVSNAVCPMMGYIPSTGNIAREHDEFIIGFWCTNDPYTTFEVKITKPSSQVWFKMSVKSWRHQSDPQSCFCFFLVALYWLVHIYIYHPPSLYHLLFLSPWYPIGGEGGTTVAPYASNVIPACQGYGGHGGWHGSAWAGDPAPWEQVSEIVGSCGQQWSPGAQWCHPGLRSASIEI